MHNFVALEKLLKLPEVCISHRKKVDNKYIDLTNFYETQRHVSLWGPAM